MIFPSEKEREPTITFPKYHDWNKTKIVTRFGAVSQENSSRSLHCGCFAGWRRLTFKMIWSYNLEHERVLAVIKSLQEPHALYFIDEENECGGEVTYTVTLSQIIQNSSYSSEIVILLLFSVTLVLHPTLRVWLRSSCLVASFRVSHICCPLTPKKASTLLTQWSESQKLRGHLLSALGNLPPHGSLSFWVFFKRLCMSETYRKEKKIF